MNIFSIFETGLSKASNFLIQVFTKTKEVEDMFVSLAPATKAAILATFYDVAKTMTTATAAAGAAATGDIPTAFTLSAETIALIKIVITDAKTDESVIASDLKSLGITA